MYMELVEPIIRKRINTLEQEDLYLISCKPLGSGWDGVGQNRAVVFNHKANELNIRIFKSLEKEVKNQMDPLKITLRNIEMKMKLQTELNNLITMGV